MMHEVERPLRRRRGTGALVVVASFMALLVAGNLALLTVHWWADAPPRAQQMSVPGIGNFQVVDNHLWRGAAPSAEEYQALARRGVATVVDLRHDDEMDDEDAYRSMLGDLGVRVVSLPVRDGHAPRPSIVRRFLAEVRRDPGLVFVHCSAGNGRSSTMVAAYLVSDRGLSSSQALREVASVGPPSLEQLAFITRLHPDGISRPSPFVVALSRFLDGPRRLATYFRF